LSIPTYFTSLARTGRIRCENISGLPAQSCAQVSNRFVFKAFARHGNRVALFRVRSRLTNEPANTKGGNAK
jgi:hypothetical protein